jgi:hypothetical protein
VGDPLQLEPVVPELVSPSDSDFEIQTDSDVDDFDFDYDFWNSDDPILCESQFTDARASD